MNDVVEDEDEAERLLLSSLLKLMSASQFHLQYCTSISTDRTLKNFCGEPFAYANPGCTFPHPFHSHNHSTHNLSIQWSNSGIWGICVVIYRHPLKLICWRKLFRLLCVLYLAVCRRYRDFIVLSSPRTNHQMMMLRRNSRQCDNPLDNCLWWISCTEKFLFWTHSYHHGHMGSH